MNIKKLLRLIELYSDLGMESIIEIYKSNASTVTSRRSAIKNGIDISNCTQFSIHIPRKVVKFYFADTDEPIKYGDMTLNDINRLVEKGEAYTNKEVKGAKRLTVYDVSDTLTREYRLDVNKLKDKLNVKTTDEVLDYFEIEDKLVREILKSMLDKREFSGADKINIDNIEYICNYLIVVIEFMDRIFERPKLIDLKFEYAEEKANRLLGCIRAFELNNMINDGG